MLKKKPDIKINCYLPVYIYFVSKIYVPEYRMTKNM